MPPLDMDEEIDTDDTRLLTVPLDQEENYETKSDLDANAVRPQEQEMVSRHLVDSSSDEDDIENEGYTRRGGASQSRWWFLEPAIKKNCWIMFLIILFIAAGIGCFIVGIILEIIYHTGSDDIIRGFIFIIVAFIVLLPSVYAIIHVYLAAKRVGRVRFSSVWFFPN